MAHDCPRVPHLGLCSVAALLRLHRKSKSLDTYLDDRLELSTTRVAWNEITDNVERGAFPYSVPDYPELIARDGQRRARAPPFWRTSAPM